jgi:hypothetical protein
MYRATAKIPHLANADASSAAAVTAAPPPPPPVAAAADLVGGAVSLFKYAHSTFALAAVEDSHHSQDM